MQQLLFIRSIFLFNIPASPPHSTVSNDRNSCPYSAYRHSKWNAGQSHRLIVYLVIVFSHDVIASYGQCIELCPLNRWINHEVSQVKQCNSSVKSQWCCRQAKHVDGFYIKMTATLFARLQPSAASASQSFVSMINAIQPGSINGGSRITIKPPLYLRRVFLNDSLMVGVPYAKSSGLINLNILFPNERPEMPDLDTTNGSI